MRKLSCNAAKVLRGLENGPLPKAELRRNLNGSVKRPDRTIASLIKRNYIAEGDKGLELTPKSLALLRR